MRCRELAIKKWPYRLVASLEETLRICKEANAAKPCEKLSCWIRSLSEVQARHANFLRLSVPSLLSRLCTAQGAIETSAFIASVRANTVSLAKARLWAHKQRHALKTKK